MLRILVLAMATFAVGTDGFVINGLLPAVARDLGVPVAGAGQLVAAFALTYAVLSPVLGALTARFARTRVVLGGLGVFVASNVLTALATTYEVAMASRILAGAAAAVITPNVVAVAVALAGEQRRGRALALVMGGLSVASAVGVPLGTWIGGTDWRLTLWLVAAVGAAAWIGILVGVPALVLPGPARLRDRLAPLADRRVLAAALTTTLTFAALYTTVTYVAPVLAPATGGDAGLLAVLLAITGIAGVAGNAVAGHLTDRRGARPVVLGGLTGLIVLQALLLLPVSMTVAVVWAVGGAVVWLTVVGQQHRMVTLAPQSSTAALGINGSALYLGTALGSAAGGVALGIGGTGAVVGTAVAIAAIAAVFTAATFRPSPAKVTV
ncbi:MFS transporter [Pseudonocardia sp. CA-107938]|uniref:MFS transporter n=1 Tax=Pseudonocardia sp. CA-107938 TaxID=3240021 RepID=UPI003D89B73A